MTQISITRTTTPRTTPADETLSFGNVFSDHMFMMDYDDGQGWHSPRILDGECHSANRMRKTP